MDYIYFELKTSGTTPLFSRITELNILVHEDSFRTLSFLPSSLSEEYSCLREFAGLLANVPAIACPDETQVKYLADCFKQYFIKNPFTDKTILGPDDKCFDSDAVCTETYTGELKLFYTKWKDYYYFPLEDAAYHKSVARFADKSSRVKATPQTAYIKRTGTFVPAPYISDKVFRKDFDSTDYYIPIEHADGRIKLHAILSAQLKYV